MTGNRHATKCVKAACLTTIVGWVAVSIASGAFGGQRILFSPKFTIRETLRYQIDTRTTSTGKTTTPTLRIPRERLQDEPSR